MTPDQICPCPRLDCVAARAAAASIDVAGSLKALNNTMVERGLKLEALERVLTALSNKYHLEVSGLLGVDETLLKRVHALEAALVSVGALAVSMQRARFPGVNDCTCGSCVEAAADHARRGGAHVTADVLAIAENGHHPDDGAGGKHGNG